MWHFTWLWWQQNTGAAHPSSQPQLLPPHELDPSDLPASTAGQGHGSGVTQAEPRNDLHTDGVLSVEWNGKTIDHNSRYTYHAANHYYCLWHHYYYIQSQKSSWFQQNIIHTHLQRLNEPISHKFELSVCLAILLIWSENYNVLLSPSMAPNTEWETSLSINLPTHFDLICFQSHLTLKVCISAGLSLWIF